MGNFCSSPTDASPIAGLQAELQAAYQEGECVKRKVKQQEAEMEVFRKKFSAREEELESVYRKLNMELYRKFKVNLKI